MERKNRDYNLQERLMKFAMLINDIVGDLPNSPIGKYLAGQLIRSGTSPALHYSEACAAESPRDFVHKMSVVLKELRESHSACNLIKDMRIGNEERITAAAKEGNELISIFVASIKTAKANNDIK